MTQDPTIIGQIQLGQGKRCWWASPRYRYRDGFLSLHTPPANGSQVLATLPPGDLIVHGGDQRGQVLAVALVLPRDAKKKRPLNVSDYVAVRYLKVSDKLTTNRPLNIHDTAPAIGTLGPNVAINAHRERLYSLSVSSWQSLQREYAQWPLKSPDVKHNPSPRSKSPVEHARVERPNAPKLGKQGKQPPAPHSAAGHEQLKQPNASEPRKQRKSRAKSSWMDLFRPIGTVHLPPLRAKSHDHEAHPPLIRDHLNALPLPREQAHQELPTISGFDPRLAVQRARIRRQEFEQVAREYSGSVEVPANLSREQLIARMVSMMLEAARREAEDI